MNGTIQETVVAFFPTEVKCLQGINFQTFFKIDEVKLIINELIINKKKHYFYNY